MSISFSCACGKSFAVADDFAGKRTKCPACAAALTVPTPVTEPAPTAAPPAADAEEDAAFRALMDAPEPEPGAAVRPVPALPSALDMPPPHRPAPPPPPAEPKSSRKAKRGPKYVLPLDGEHDRPPAPRIALSPAVAGGLLAMVAAAVWFGVGYAAGRIYIYPPIMFLFGFVNVVRGLLGLSED